MSFWNGAWACTYGPVIIWNAPAPFMWMLHAPLNSTETMTQRLNKNSWQTFKKCILKKKFKQSLQFCSVAAKGLYTPFRIKNTFIESIKFIELIRDRYLRWKACSNAREHFLEIFTGIQKQSHHNNILFTNFSITYFIFSLSPLWW